jgi:hypothetical protein
LNREENDEVDFPQLKIGWNEDVSDSPVLSDVSIPIDFDVCSTKSIFVVCVASRRARMVEFGLKQLETCNETPSC